MHYSILASLKKNHVRTYYRFVSVSSCNERRLMAIGNITTSIFQGRSLRKNDTRCTVVTSDVLCQLGEKTLCTSMVKLQITAQRRSLQVTINPIVTITAGHYDTECSTSSELAASSTIAPTAISSRNKPAS